MSSDREPPAFGALLRRLRGAAGLTQEALAERAGLSSRTVRGLERGETRPYPHTAARLRRALSLPPERGAAFVAAARAVARRPAGAAVGRAGGRATPAPAAPAAGAAPASRRDAPHNLPAPLTALVGREGHLAAVAESLAEARLLTLTGPGGVGKTRLALAVAALAAAGAGGASRPGAGGPYPDGVWLAELAALAEAALVPQALASAVGVREAPGRPLLEALCRALRPRRLLLVLDNCEHLLDACAGAADALLRACPGVRVLATSRRALGLAGEVAWGVPPLAWPATPAGAAPPEPTALLAFGAVRLFCERAAAARPGFALTPANARAVVDVCARLDGLPLALELAARRTAALAPAELAARLEADAGLLAGGPAAPPRQRTLRATLDWSYGLLAPAERGLLARLSVFAGGWTLEAAEAVGAVAAGPRAAVLNGLLRLVDQSLVVAEAGPDGATRYRMLETVRRYAAERLRRAGAARGAAVCRRHLDWCLAVAAAADTALVASELGAGLRRLDAEHANLREALAWCAEHDPGAGLRLAGHLARYWRMRSHHAEAAGWLARLLDRGPPRGAARVELLLGAAALALDRWDLAEARGRLAEALAIARGLGDDRLLALTLREAGNLHIAVGDLPAARARLEESLTLAGARGDDRARAAAAILLSLVERDEDALARARTRLEEGLTLARAVGDQTLINLALRCAGRLALRAGDLAEAERLLLDCLAEAEALRSSPGLTRLRDYLGRVAYARGDLARAAAWHESGLSLARETADEQPIALHLIGLGRVACAGGAAGRAGRLLEEARERLERLGDRRSLAACQRALALAAWDRGDGVRARALLGESLAACRALGDREGIAGCLEGLAAVAAGRDDADAADDAGGPAQAARLLGAAAALRARIAAPQAAPDGARLASTGARVRARLGPEAWAAALAAGEARALAETISEAQAPPAPAGAGRTGTGRSRPGGGASPRPG
jgi:predicted ATPase/transcriptional regulator with XRE-family HTH domain